MSNLYFQFIEFIAINLKLKIPAFHYSSPNLLFFVVVVNEDVKIYDTYYYFR